LLTRSNAVRGNYCLAALQVTPNDRMTQTQKRQFLPTFVRQWREYRNLSLDQLADGTDLTQSHLSMLERGQRG
jgi:hypothetical protein